MPKSEFRKGQIHYQARGKGRTLVLLHGFLESAEIWNSLSDTLCTSNRVISIDLPGHGQSDCFGYIHSMELMASAVFSVLEKLKIRKFIVAGHSMGGYVALAMAKKVPPGLQGIILFQSTPLSDTEEKKAERERIAKMIPFRKDAFITQALPGLFHPDILSRHPALPEGLINLALKTSVRGVIAALRGMKNRHDSLVFVENTALPVCFIMGSDDRVLPLPNHGEFWKRAKKGKLIILPECGHVGMLENPSASIKALRLALQFCREHQVKTPEINTDWSS